MKSSLGLKRTARLMAARNRDETALQIKWQVLGHRILTPRQYGTSKVIG